MATNFSTHEVDDQRSIDLPAETNSAGAARAFIRETLREWKHLNVEAELSLAVTELVTNAVIHAHSGARVTLLHSNGAIQLRVGDSAPTPPVLGVAGEAAESGRGMQLVDAVCDQWGVEDCPPGKIIWLDITAVE